MIRAIYEFVLTVLIDASDSGKSTLARKHCGAFETISSGFCRGLVSDDKNDQAASGDAFDVLRRRIERSSQVAGTFNSLMVKLL
jgi:predicted kinase